MGNQFTNCFFCEKSQPSKTSPYKKDSLFLEKSIGEFRAARKSNDEFLSDLLVLITINNLNFFSVLQTQDY